MDRLQRAAHWLRSKAANWICERLSGYISRRTSGEILSASAAIAVVQTLNLEALLEIPEESWPEGIIDTMSIFTEAEWRETLRSTYFDKLPIERALRRPEWAHLRRKPIG